MYITPLWTVCPKLNGHTVCTFSKFDCSRLDNVDMVETWKKINKGIHRKKKEIKSLKNSSYLHVIFDNILLKIQILFTEKDKQRLI